MSFTVNGQSRVPPGFRFHPTEEELLNYYLRKKVACERIDLDVIRDVDLNKLEPWDIQEKCKIGTTPQNDWYFFSHKDKKYPTGTRTNRATAAGFWKATGRDKVIHTSCQRIGMRKTLVFYRGRAPHGQKSDWIMHEYRLDELPDANSQFPSNASSSIGDAPGQEDGWVVCRVFKKKNLLKAAGSPNNCSSSMPGDAKTQLLHSRSDAALDQILQYLGRSCKQESETSIANTGIPHGSNNKHHRHLRPIETMFSTGLHDRFMKLPPLESPAIPSPPPPEPYSCANQAAEKAEDSACLADQGLSDWAALDRLIASHLNGQSEASKQLTCFDDPTFTFSGMSHDDQPGGGGSGNSSGGDGDLWSLASSASDHFSHVSHASL